MIRFKTRNEAEGRVQAQYDSTAFFGPHSQLVLSGVTLGTYESCSFGTQTHRRSQYSVPVVEGAAKMSMIMMVNHRSVLDLNFALMVGSISI